MSNVGKGMAEDAAAADAQKAPILKAAHPQADDETATPSTACKPGSSSSCSSSNASGDEATDNGASELLANQAAAGSGLAVARLLVEGRHVLSKVSGRLGVILRRDKDAADTQSSSDRSYQVRLSNGGSYWYTRSQLEPWTRGITVVSCLSGKRGEIIRVDQRLPPSSRPYLVRLEDGSEFWYSLDAVRFEHAGLQGLNRSQASYEEQRRQLERCSVSLVPGRWKAVLPSGIWPCWPGSAAEASSSSSSSSASAVGGGLSVPVEVDADGAEARVQITVGTDGKMTGSGFLYSDRLTNAADRTKGGAKEETTCSFPVALQGSQDSSGLVECSVKFISDGRSQVFQQGSGSAVRGSYKHCAVQRSELAQLDGTWQIHDVDLDLTASKARWVVVESGRASRAGHEVGTFRLPWATSDAPAGNNVCPPWSYTQRESGRTHHVLLFDPNTLCWECGAVWRRLSDPEGLIARASALLTGQTSFDSPKKSEQRGDDDDDPPDDCAYCEVQSIEPTADAALSVTIEASSIGQLSDPLKTELIIDGRTVVAAVGEYAASVARGKRKRSNIKGKLVFHDVQPRQGSDVKLRYGGEYSGFTWAQLLEPCEAFSELSGGLYWLSNPLRQYRLRGRVGANGTTLEGRIDSGPDYVVTGKTAKDISVSKEGSSTTFARKPYEDDDSARIEILGPAVLDFKFFKTEATYDTMTIAGVDYSGDEELPPDHYVPEGRKTILTWQSDASTTDEGWEFAVRFGIAKACFGQRACAFGARAAPWTSSLDDAAHFVGAFVHVPTNPQGACDFTASEVEGRVLWLTCADAYKTTQEANESGAADAQSDAASGGSCREAEDASSNAKEDGDAERVPADSELFRGILREPLLRAKKAGAKAVVFVASSAEKKGVRIWQAAPSDESGGDDKAADVQDTLLPAVIVGHEFGCDVLDCLRRGQPAFGLRLDDAADCLSPVQERDPWSFSLQLVECTGLDASRESVRLCLGSANYLRRLVAAEAAAVTGRPAEDLLAAASSKLPLGEGDLLKLCERLFRPIRGAAAVPSAAGDASTPSASPGLLRSGWIKNTLAALRAQVRHGGTGDSESEVMSFDLLADLVRELLRKLMPVALPPQAVLPRPGDRGRGDIWTTYSKGRSLGSGAFGVVRQAWDRYVGEHVAVKKIKLKEGKTSWDSDLEEFDLLRDMSHPNLMRVLDLHVAGRTLYLVTDFAGDGDLTQHICSARKVQERWVAGVVRQVLSACAFLHRRKIVHHDIKPANVLVTCHKLAAPEETVPLILLADFGLAQTEGFEQEESVDCRGAGNGTSCYMAPESAHHLSGPKTDVYAVGIMLFELLSGGTCPDPITDDGEVDDIDWTLFDHCTEEAVSTTKALVAADVGFRSSARAALQRDWFYPKPREEVDGESVVACKQTEKSPAPSRKELAATIRHLHKNCELDFLQRAAANLLVSQLGRGLLEPVRMAFESMDADRDGVLSLGDIKSACLKADMDDATVAPAILTAADVHGRGVLEFREFCAAFLDLQELPPQAVRGALEKLFMQLCGPGDDALRLSAILNRVACMDEGDLENIAALFDRHDVSGDGRLTKAAFFELFRASDFAEPFTMLEPPAPATPLVRMLRGSAKNGHIEAGFVKAWDFVTFGQPAFAKTTGRWYYELCITKMDSPQVGWVDLGFDITDGPSDDGVGDDAHGWAVDGERELKWHNGSYRWEEVWHLPCVLGCAIEFDDAANSVRMSFSTDGRWCTGNLSVIAAASGRARVRLLSCGIWHIGGPLQLLPAGLSILAS
eukprot:TRINITY_DN9906_c0_g1_i2.p1 TRINITY_DN9906_c0_g1~~TRINITY_DN9906_c0_g1_i2.p1  ORF type:complete len:1795 (+),score=374.70 TRINITY_DN9906_c0_g1_i2:60-5387(+)